MMDLFKVLRDQGAITAENYNLLANASKADKKEVEAIKVDAKKGANSAVKITTEGKLKIEMAIGHFVLLVV